MMNVLFGIIQITSTIFKDNPEIKPVWELMKPHTSIKCLYHIGYHI